MCSMGYTSAEALHGCGYNHSNQKKASKHSKHKEDNKSPAKGYKTDPNSKRKHIQQYKSVRWGPPSPIVLYKKVE